MGWTTSVHRDDPTKVWYARLQNDTKPVSTPVNPDVKLVACEKLDDVCNQQLDQAVVGSLLYLSTKNKFWARRQVNKSVEYRDGTKSKESRQG